MMTHKQAHLQLNGRMPSARRCAMAMICLAMLSGMSAGCRQDMRDQAKLQPLETSAFFVDGQASRRPPEHTIARGQLRLDTHRYEGRVDGQFATSPPMPVGMALLQRGQERFQIFCAPCHDRTGSGNGIIVQRGYRKPRSFHDPDLRAQPDGYYFDVMTRGFGTMPDYASQVPVEDRWAIVAYLRALQLSQHVEVRRLDQEVTARLTANPDVQPGDEDGQAEH